MYFCYCFFFLNKSNYHVIFIELKIANIYGEENLARRRLVVLSLRQTINIPKSSASLLHKWEFNPNNASSSFLLPLNISLLQNPKSLHPCSNGFQGARIQCGNAAQSISLSYTICISLFQPY